MQLLYFIIELSYRDHTTTYSCNLAARARFICSKNILPLTRLGL